MVDLCGNATHTNARLDSFYNYNIQLNTFRLAQLGFSHLKDNILFCRRCKGLFITWQEDITFFEEHIDSLCMHEDPDFKLHGNHLHNQCLDEWLSKKEVKSLAMDYWRVFNRQDLKKLLKAYFWCRGNNSSTSDFKQFIKHLFRNHISYS